MAPVVVGVVGRIGSGKTTLCASTNLPWINADELGHEVYQPGSNLNEQLGKYFGVEIMNSDGSINRPKLGKLVFENPEKLQALQNFVWPEIGKLLERRLAKMDTPVVLLEAAVLIEAGWTKYVDAVLVVDCSDEDEIVHRVSGRQNTLSQDQIRKRITAQLPLENIQSALKMLGKPYAIIDTQCSEDIAAQRFCESLQRLTH